MEDAFGTQRRWNSSKPARDLNIHTELYLGLSSLFLPVSNKKVTVTAVYGRAQSQNLFITSLLPMKVIFHQNSFSIEGCLASKVVFYRSLSSSESCLPFKVVFHRRLSSIKGRLPSKDVIHRSSLSIEGRHNNPSCRSESSNYKLGHLDKDWSGSYEWRGRRV